MSVSTVLKRISRWSPLVLLVLLAGCSTTRTAVVDYDRNVDFSRYKTFSFYQPEQTAGQQDEQNYQSLTSQHFRTAIMNQMQSLGYQYDENAPQLQVNYATISETRTDIQSSPFRVNVGYGFYGSRSSIYTGFPLYGNNLRQVRYRVGTVVIELIDTAQKRLVWEGSLEGRMSKKPAENPQQSITEIVDTIFQGFPGRQPVVTN
ncbi:DUF4136 domain-containing protein [Chromatiaceae bacterium AAb-1]|nr:DUF4136 domain-containing protein [Chromatiaceae bacterium AAb-1]